jgi:hypothetical protein
MALRLHRITDEQWQRLAAARRGFDLAGSPPRTAIGAIEIELRALGSQPVGVDVDEYPQAAAG